MSPATSVIIPCYNGEQYLPAALESVRAQTVLVHEIIIVDDGSAVPIRAPEGWNGPPLRLIRTPNRGQTTARNLALTYAAGDFVAFLDSDDMWVPRKVEEQEKVLRGDPSAVACYTRCARAPGFYQFGPYPPPNVPEDEFLLMMWYHNFFPPSSVMARRKTLVAAGGFCESLRYGEDVDLWFRILKDGHFVQVPEPLCYYRQHEGQFTNDTYRKMLGGKRTRATMIARAWRPPGPGGPTAK